MNEEGNNLAPRQPGAEDLMLPEEPTPQDFGFPAEPNAAQVKSWMRQQLWLEAFAECGSIGEACAATGIPVPTAEHWASVDSYGFKKRKAWAAQMAVGKLDAEINRRAIEGIDHPVIHQGVITDTYKQYSDNLLMFRAKRLDPAYKDSYSPPPNERPPVTKIIIHMPPGVELPAPREVAEGVIPTEYVHRELPTASEGEYREVEGDTPD